MRRVRGISPLRTYLLDSSSFSALSRSAQFWSSYSGYLREVRAYIISSPLVIPFLFPDQPSCVLHSAVGMILVRSCGFHTWITLTVTCSDTARDIYRNATLEKTAFLRFLIAREKALHSNIQIWETQLAVRVCSGPSINLLMERRPESARFDIGTPDGCGRYRNQYSSVNFIPGQGL